MDHDDLLALLASKLSDLAFDYDRFSTSGKETYDEIMSIVNMLRS